MLNYDATRCVRGGGSSAEQYPSPGRRRGVLRRLSCDFEGVPRLYLHPLRVTRMSTRRAESSPVELHTTARSACNVIVVLLFAGCSNLMFGVATVCKFVLDSSVTSQKKETCWRGRSGSTCIDRSIERCERFDVRRADRLVPKTETAAIEQRRFSDRSRAATRRSRIGEAFSRVVSLRVGKTFLRIRAATGEECTSLSGRCLARFDGSMP
jgi:hypothetical protein